MNQFFIDANIAKANTLDTDFYTSPEHFNVAKEKIFASSWQFIGNTSLVKIPGDIHPFTLLENYLNEP